MHNCADLNRKILNETVPAFVKETHLLKTTQILQHSTHWGLLSFHKNSCRAILTCSSFTFPLDKCSWVWEWPRLGIIISGGQEGIKLLGGYKIRALWGQLHVHSFITSCCKYWAMKIHVGIPLDHNFTVFGKDVGLRYQKYGEHLAGGYKPIIKRWVPHGRVTGFHGHSWPCNTLDVFRTTHRQVVSRYSLARLFAVNSFMYHLRVADDNSGSCWSFFMLAQHTGMFITVTITIVLATIHNIVVLQSAQIQIKYHRLYKNLQHHWWTMNSTSV